MAFNLSEENEHEMRSFTGISRRLIKREPVRVKSGMLKRFGWFFLANAAIVLSLSIITAGAALSLAPFLLAFSCLFPFVTLLFSRWLAKRTHQMELIDPQRFESEDERSLYELVDSLSRRAGLTKTPQVGIYYSPEVNAFATGASKNASLVAFSTGLLESMDEQAIAAVAAHEIAHIANGDMITMTLVQSVINCVIYLITLPLTFIKWAAFFSEDVSAAVFWLISALKFLITVFLLFLGGLVVKAFSRHREFKADQLAAQLLNRDAMIHALQSLRQDRPVILKHQKAYAAFKINSPGSWADIFSTHPSLERRIVKLQQMAD